MGKRESAVVTACLGIVVPVCCFFAAWLGSVPLAPERAVAAWALSGLGVGILLEALFLRRWTALLVLAQSFHTAEAAVLSSRGHRRGD